MCLPGVAASKMTGTGDDPAITGELPEEQGWCPQ